MSVKPLRQAQEHSLAQWGLELADLALECDGMTRVFSTRLQRAGISHRVMVGSFEVAGVGLIPLHWWIELPDNRVLDLRARMWLGVDERVPHGVFAPSSTQRYQATSELHPPSVRLSPAVYWVLTSRPLDE